MTIEVARKLVRLRKKNGFSQEELAEHLGVSRQAVSKWERAEASPDTDNLIALARLYNISLDMLLELEVNASIPVTQPVFQKGINLRKESSNSESLREYKAEAFPNDNYCSEEIFPDSSIKIETVPHAVPQPNVQNQSPPPVQNACSSNRNTYRSSGNYKNHKKFNWGEFACILFIAIAFWMVPIQVSSRYDEVSWLALLGIPIYYSFKNAVKKRDMAKFCYPLVAFAFFHFGMGYTGFNRLAPLGMLLTIPIYYGGVALLKKLRKFLLGNGNNGGSV